MNDWREESRARVDEAARKARYTGAMQTKDNLAELEKARDELQTHSQESTKKDYK